MKPFIRSMASSDLESVQEMMSELHRIHTGARPDFYVETETPLSEEYFRRWLNDPDFIVLTAEADGPAAGFCVVSLRSPSGNPVMMQNTTAFMEDIYVRGELRGRGIGRMLYEEALRRAQAAGAVRLDLMVWSFNQAALDFYTRMGMSARAMILERRL